MDLIERVRKAGWVPSVPDGRNFKGMTLAGYALNDTPDSLAGVKYRITLDEWATENKFVIEGYCFSDMLMGVERGEPIWGLTTFAGQVLKDKPEEGTRLYRVTIEVI